MENKKDNRVCMMKSIIAILFLLFVYTSVFSQNCHNQFLRKEWEKKEVSVEEITNIDTTFCKVYPNPFSNNLKIKFQNDINSKILINIIDINGKNVSNNEFKNATSNTEIEIDLHKLQVGSYYIEVKVNDRHYKEKIIKREG